jgi:hypothetical protein
MSIRRRVARRGQKKPAVTEPAPMSTRLFEFAKPMLDTMPLPLRLPHMKAAMSLAMLAWNLPILERDGDAKLAAEYRTMVDVELATKPAFARALVASMMASRLARFPDDDRLVGSVDVIQDGTEIRILTSESRAG